MEVCCPICTRHVRLSPTELASKDRLKAVHCDTCGSNFDARALLASGPAIAPTAPPAKPITHRVQVAPEKPGSSLLKKQPKFIGNYEVLEEINRGGMGIVYKAIDPQLKRKVAIKVLLAGEGASESDTMRFKREAQSTARLQHPNIVPIYAVGEHNGQPYFVMDFIEGKTAKQLKDRGEMTPRLALKIIEGVAEALAHAHANGVFHRDVKPANILVDADERPQLMDFGLARRADEDLEITQSGTTMGTPSYMAPEQAEGKMDLVDGQSDVYSAGACLYELLTGRPPFEGETTLQVLRQIIDDPPVPPRKLNPSINHDVETICLKCLEKNKALRYASAKDLADDIRRFNDGEAIAAKPLSDISRFMRWLKRHKELSIATVLVALAAAGVIYYSLNQSHVVAKKEIDDRAERFSVAMKEGNEELERARDIIQTFGVSKPPAEGVSASAAAAQAQSDFEKAVSNARDTLAAAERHFHQAEALFPDNGDLRSAFERHRKTEAQADIKRFIVKARMFLHPPDLGPNGPPAIPNYAGAEFAAQEAADRDPKNDEARALLREARGIRKVTLVAEQRGGSPVECEVYARRFADTTGRAIPAGVVANLGNKLGMSPLNGAELEPGNYVISFVRKGMPPQQATFSLTRETPDQDLYLSLPIDAKEENMAQISAGEARVGGRAVKVTMFAIDRYEYPNRPGAEPLTGVSLIEARQACEKAGKKLCTSAQWERACAGDAPRRFPYGENYVSGACAVGLDGIAQARPLPSGYYTRCKTADGVYDMAGNAAEWADGASEALYGGDWTSSVRTPDLSVSCRASNSAEDVNKDRRGFRCCK